MDSPVTQQMTRASLNVAFESTSLRQSLVASVGKEMAPQELPLPGTRPTATEEVTVDTNILRNTPEKVAGLRQLRVLEELLRHELLDDDERQELRDRVIHLLRHLSR
jgi:hypothetical protein